ncbi:hypothetical protein HK096_004923 [Nowakowskiella sp. JEL0078]|nr:hypothetical protein HK096_004923 [Nowakowskiella sp. JEL0078]
MNGSTPLSLSQGRAFVKNVVSGDTVVLRAKPVNAPPVERILSFSNVSAPRLGTTKDFDKEEPFAFQSREYLRKLIVGKEVAFKVEYTTATNKRDFGVLLIAPPGIDGETNVTRLLVKEEIPGLMPSPELGTSYFTPRQFDVQHAAKIAIAEDKKRPLSQNLHPIHILMNAVDDSVNLEADFDNIFKIFERKTLSPGQILWLPGDDANELLIVEEGELISISETEDKSSERVVETLLSGTMIGELEMFSDRPRSGRLQVSGHSNTTVIWELSREAYQNLENTNPKLAIKFVRLVLTFDCERMENVVKHAASLW